jgi:hypothetical protein
MNWAATLIGGAGLGAGLMYVLDAQLGTRRRALIRDKIVRITHKAGDAIDTTARDLSHRTKGVVATAGSRLRSDHPSDEVLVERVRAKLGRLVSHPKSIEVSAHEGRVTLRGPILSREVSRLLSRLS